MCFNSSAHFPKFSLLPPVMHPVKHFSCCLVLIKCQISLLLYALEQKVREDRGWKRAEVLEDTELKCLSQMKEYKSNSECNVDENAYFEVCLLRTSLDTFSDLLAHN